MKLNSMIASSFIFIKFDSFKENEMKENKYQRFIKGLVINDEGASAIEYALIAAMVAIVLVTFVTPIGDALRGIFQQIQTALSA